MSGPLKPQQDNPRATDPPTEREKQAKPEQPASDEKRLSPDATTQPSIKNK